MWFPHYKYFISSLYIVKNLWWNNQKSTHKRMVLTEKLKGKFRLSRECSQTVFLINSLPRVSPWPLARGRLLTKVIHIFHFPTDSPYSTTYALFYSCPLFTVEKNRTDAVQVPGCSLATNVKWNIHELMRWTAFKYFRRRARSFARAESCLLP